MLLSECLAEFVFHCQYRKLSPNTTRNYEKQIQYLLNYLHEEHSVEQLEQVAPRHIKQFLAVVSAKGRKPSYVNDLLKAFKVFFRYLNDEGYTEKPVTSTVKGVREPKVIIKTFSPADIKGIVYYYNGRDYLSVRNRTMLAFLFDTGIRLNELITLTEEQIFHDYVLIHGKGSKERVVPKSPYLGKCMFKYMRVRESYFQYRAIPYSNLFLSKNGKPLTSEAVSKMLKKAGDDVGVTGIRVSPHTCRHTFAQMQLQNGLDIYSLSRLMGHESITITQRYLEGIKDRDVLAASTKTSPLMNL